MARNKYYISKYEYLELKYFCLQYPKNSAIVDSALKLATDNEVIREHLRKSVTTDTKFDLLDVPMGRNQFYALRRKFFYILLELKKGTN